MPPSPAIGSVKTNLDSIRGLAVLLAAGSVLCLATLLAPLLGPDDAPVG